MSRDGEKMRLLAETLPHIRRHRGKTIIVKYGGAAMRNERLKTSVARDLALLSVVGVRVVLVHGGGPELSATLERFGKESHFVGGLRHTDAETAEIAVMVLAGKVNKELVARIRTVGGRAMGLCGIDGGLFLCEKLKAEEDLGFVGDIRETDAAAVETALFGGFVPVIATVGTDDAGRVYNINADTAAAALACAMKADKLIFMTDVAGVLARRDDESSLIRAVDVREAPKLIERGVISGGMIPKTTACVRAVESGIGEAVILDGRREHAVLEELFSEAGNGTLFYAKRRAAEEKKA